MAARYFTVEEANALLAEVRPLVERMVEHRRRLAAAMARQERLAAAIAGNGGRLDPGALARAQSEIDEHAAGVASSIERVHALGVLVKDVDVGLVDFPALRNGEEVLLCWHLGEDEIGYWHGLEDGYAGRRPLPL